MNKNGFTMIELLGTMVLLSIILLIAIPSVTKIVDSSKKRALVNDAKKFIALAKAAEKRANNQYKKYKPINGCGDDKTCYEVDISDIEISPYNKKYTSDSYVEKRNNKYYVYLIDDAGHKIYEYEEQLDSIFNNNYIEVKSISCDNIDETALKKILNHRCTVIPSNATNKDVSLSIIDDKNVIWLYSNSSFRTNSIGTATVEAKTSNNIKTTFEVKVRKVLVSSFTITNCESGTVHLNVNQAIEFKATDLKPTNVSDSEIVWAFDRDFFKTISKGKRSIKLRALSSGTFDLYAKANTYFGNSSIVSKKCTIRVSK